MGREHADVDVDDGISGLVDADVGVAERRADQFAGMVRLVVEIPVGAPQVTLRVDQTLTHAFVDVSRVLTAPGIGAEEDSVTGHGARR